jgi:hypothetical protein
MLVLPTFLLFKVTCLEVGGKMGMRELSVVMAIQNYFVMMIIQL